MRNFKKYSFPFLFCCVAFFSCVNDHIDIPEKKDIKDTTSVDPNDTTKTDTLDPCRYGDEIKLIVTTNCALSGCHGSGSGSGDFTGYTDLKVRADNGKLENRVLIEKNMPPSEPLSQEDRDKIQCWIDKGAPND